MKTLSASLLALMVSISFSNLSAQSKSTSSAPLGDADRLIVQSWTEEANQDREVRIEGDRLIFPADDRNAMCAYLRVYRVKRVTPGSDLTRPAGYTTCVGASRFTMRSSVIRSQEPETRQTAPTR